MPAELLLDTGGLVCLLDRRQKDHRPTLRARHEDPLTPSLLSFGVAWRTRAQTCQLFSGLFLVRVPPVRRFGLRGFQGRLPEADSSPALRCLFPVSRSGPENPGGRT